MRAVFMGGRQAGCVGLLTSLCFGCEIDALVAYDDQIRMVAGLLDLPLRHSISETQGSLADADVLISVHGREFVPPELLALPRLGGINVHPCLYAYKGADPVARLLADRNTRASVAVHRMTDELDEGEVLVEEFVDVTGDQTGVEVYNRLYPYYATALYRALQALARESSAERGADFTPSRDPGAG
jgi:methionyl-tRNA formyltransferase